jgi:hypothetical protein
LNFGVVPLARTAFFLRLPLLAFLVLRVRRVLLVGDAMEASDFACGY